MRKGLSMLCGQCRHGRGHVKVVEEASRESTSVWWIISMESGSPLGSRDVRKGGNLQLAIPPSVRTLRILKPSLSWRTQQSMPSNSTLSLKHMAAVSLAVGYGLVDRSPIERLGRINWEFEQGRS